MFPSTQTKMSTHSSTTRDSSFIVLCTGRSHSAKLHFFVFLLIENNADGKRQEQSRGSRPAWASGLPGSQLWILSNLTTGEGQIHAGNQQACIWVAHQTLNTISELVSIHPPPHDLSMCDSPCSKELWRRDIFTLCWHQKYAFLVQTYLLMAIFLCSRL